MDVLKQRNYDTSITVPYDAKCGDVKRKEKEKYKRRNHLLTFISRHVSLFCITD